MMEILPVDHRSTEGFEVKTPKDLQPSMVLGWVRDDDGVERALVWSRSSSLWLLADGVGPAEPLPRDDQMKMTRLMAPNLRAVERALVGG